MPAWRVSNPRWVRGLVLAAACTALAASLTVVLTRSTSQPTPHDSSPSADTPPQDAGPIAYRNTRQDVAYVGDATCALCHPGQAETFHRHPMGRSLGPVASVAASQRYDPAVHNPFEAVGARFEVERQGERIFHKETHRDAAGSVFAEARVPVDYVLGSGTHNFSYLIERDGYLVQSPITFYSQKAIWDVSPGFENHGRNVFERPVGTGCLFCHANRVEPVADTLNRYRPPVFRDGAAIGCERCHGPGALHTQRHERGEVVEGPDDTIVNPRHLPWELREGVCQQCHLEGAERVLRRDRDYFDYRPGLPWQMFWTVLVRNEGTAANKFDSSVEQLYASRCFQASRGRMGCATCHDAHELPAPAERLAYYRGRCLQCHEEASACSLPREARLLQSPQDDCRACHMPSFQSSDIPHTAATDHRIPRRPAPAATPAPASPGDIPLRPFLAEIAGYKDTETSRALALALMAEAQRGPDGQRLARIALPLLEADTASGATDLPAQDARAEALALLGHPREALAICEAILAEAPRREATLHDAAVLARALSLQDATVGYRRRLLEVNPTSLQYRVGLANALAERGDWTGALAECRTILRQYPPNQEARLLLVRYHLHEGDRAQARAEFERVLALAPGRADALRRWFDEQSK